MRSPSPISVRDPADSGPRSADTTTPQARLGENRGEIAVNVKVTAPTVY
jgi:hypothetical protein